MGGVAFVGNPMLITDISQCETGRSVRDDGLIPLPLYMLPPALSTTCADVISTDSTRVTIQNQPLDVGSVPALG